MGSVKCPIVIKLVSHQNLAIFQEQHIIHPHLARFPQVADHIPVQRRLIQSTSFGITVAKREMDCSADLLIEQYILGSTRDAWVIAKSELAQVARSRVEFPLGGTAATAECSTEGA